MREKIIARRYLAPGETCMDDVYRRTARYIFDTNQTLAEEYYNLMRDGVFLPNSPALANSGRKSHANLFACFCLPIEDTLESILKCVCDTARVHKSFGGTGFNLSKLRPAGSLISTTGGGACGPLKVIELLNQTSDTLSQGGKRPGASLGLLEWDHPDIHDFIKVKDSNTNLSSFNISVGLRDNTDEDMIVEIAEHAWKTGDPGVVYLDEVERHNPTPHLGKLDHLNACSEQPLLPYESCVLGSINLSKFVNDDEEFNYEWFKAIVHYGVQFLDSMISKNEFPIPEIQEATLRNRKVGLGIMGWHDCLIKMGIPYCSNAAIDMIHRIGEVYRDEAHYASKRLAGLYDVFPSYEGSIWDKSGYPMRNAACTTIAPTGCQKASTLVMSEDGIVKLSEIGNKDGYTWQNVNINVYSDFISTLANKFYINGNTSTKKIVLYSGLELEASLEHRYRCLTSNNEYIWKTVKDIAIGDRIVSRIGGYSKACEPVLEYEDKTWVNGRNILLPEVMNPTLAEFIGILIGNGSFHKMGVRLHFNDTAVDKIEYVKDLITTLFGKIPKVRQEHTCTSIYLNNVQIKNWLIKNGLCKEYSSTASIPYKIRTASAESLHAFIDGLYFADGSSTGNSRYIDTSSKPLAQQLLVCMRALGMNGRIKTYTNVKGRMSNKPSYRVYFVNYGTVDASLSHIRYELQKNCNDAHSVDELLYCEQVIDIFDSSCNTYDLQVPIGNCYISNSVVSHNSLSYLANCSSGIEPVYEWVIDRMSAEGNEIIKHPLYDKYIAGSELERETATNIPWMWHLKHQATWQMYVDNAISKTVNLPNDASIEDVINIYRHARDMGCKGVTVYRDGSKDKQVLNKIGSKNGHNTGTTNTPRSRLDRYGITYQRQSGCGLIYLTANDCDDKPWETFVRTAGGCEATNEAIGRLISGWLQDGGDPKRIARMLRKVRCVNAMRASKSDGKSCADIIGKCIETRWGDREGVSRGQGQLVKAPGSDNVENHATCPECGAPLKFGRGCKQGECSCGWAGCS